MCSAESGVDPVFQAVETLGIYAISSLSLRERARVRAGPQVRYQTHKHRISLVLPKDRWQTANPFTPFVLRLYANVF